MSNKKIVVYLDRDGVINDISKGYVNKPENFQFIFGVPQAIKKLNQKNITTVVVTNQGGIDLGYMTENDFNEITDYMHSQLKKFGSKLDHVYYCSSNDKNNYYRKPNPGMIIESSKQLKLNNYTKYMVGDSLTDIEAGNKSLCTTILVRTGNGKKEEQKLRTHGTMLKTPNHICDNLVQAISWIFREEKL